VGPIWKHDSRHDTLFVTANNSSSLTRNVSNCIHSPLWHTFTRSYWHFTCSFARAPNSHIASCSMSPKASHFRTSKSLQSFQLLPLTSARTARHTTFPRDRTEVHLIDCRVPQCSEPHPPRRALGRRPPHTDFNIPQADGKVGPHGCKGVLKDGRL
jgi:hypothetical protein